MKIALVQTPCSLGNKEENLSSMERMLGKMEADLYVFPELFLTGYMVRDQTPQLAEEIHGESVQRVLSMAEDRDVHILFGMATIDETVPGVIRNSAVGASPNGAVQVYHKNGLATFGPFEEGLYFAPGKEPMMFEFDQTKVGVMICYDLFFPELSKWYALDGAEALICLSASPVTSRDMFEKIIPARAVENTCYVFYVNQVGCQLNQVFFGGAEAADPRGSRVAKNKYFEEDISVVELSSSILDLSRRMRPTLRDSLGL